MKVIGNSGNDRVIDALEGALTSGVRLDIASPVFVVLPESREEQAA